MSLRSAPGRPQGASIAQPQRKDGTSNRTAELALRIAGGPEAAAAARRSLDGLEGQLREPLLDDLRLLVTELVTNSIRHAGVGPAGEIAVRVRVSTASVLVDVLDGGPGFDAGRYAEPQLGVHGGWGLYLVNTIADRWGVGRQGAATRVWFEIDRNASLQRSAALVD
jgi:anti-sigma regulatory factor (Ser/Thr protein kinase)